jgi:hypothetical protein
MNEIYIIKLSSIDDFANLYDELVTDNSTFVYNIDFMYDSFKNGNMYTLMCKEQNIICNKNNKLLLPCLCIINKDNVCEILWVHTRARLKGLGKYLVTELNIQYARTPIGNSAGFWDKCEVDLL